MRNYFLNYFLNLYFFYYFQDFWNFYSLLDNFFYYFRTTLNKIISSCSCDLWFLIFKYWIRLICLSLYLSTKCLLTLNHINYNSLFLCINLWISQACSFYRFIKFSLFFLFLHWFYNLFRILGRIIIKITVIWSNNFLKFRFNNIGLCFSIFALNIWILFLLIKDLYYFFVLLNLLLIFNLNVNKFI